MDLSKRLSSGHKVGEVIRLASTWWDRVGRKIISHKDFKDPDLGFKYGVTRGLKWDHLNASERKSVVSAYYHNQLLYPMLNEAADINENVSNEARRIVREGLFNG